MSSATPPVTSGSARHRGVGLHFLTWSPDGDGRPPVVLVPGLSDVAEDYREVLPLFGRRAVVMDLRGRGGSDVPDTGYRRDDHVDDIEAVLAAAGVDRFHLATFSRGTAYGLGYLVRHPERVLSVSVGDYPAREIGLANGFPAGFADSRWRGTPVHERISPSALERIAEQSEEHPFWDDLARLGKPLLVIRGGRQDRPGFVDDAALQRYRSAVPDVRVETLPGSSHDVFRPDPTAYPRLVASFAGGHDPQD